MHSVGSKPSLWPKPIHPDSESGLQWFAHNFVTGPDRMARVRDKKVTTP